MTGGEWAAVIAAGGGALTALSLILKESLGGVRALRSGKATAERVRNRSILERMEAAEAEADRESAYRRVLAEYASTLRRLLIDHGIPEHLVPPWPPRP